MELEKRTSPRIHGLDGLRALAIIGVLLGHVITSPGFPNYDRLRAILLNGGVGVKCFFVLSGYLITCLLLEEEAENGRISLRGFYVRRAFRILTPAYAYLGVLSLLTLFHIMHVPRSGVAAAAFFVANYFDASQSTAHFWSLAVEEQFYLLWPLIVVLLRPRVRLPVSAALLLLCTLWESLRFQALPDVHLPAFDLHCDTLLAGCCLALARNKRQLLPIFRTRVFQHSMTPWMAFALVGLCRSRYFVDYDTPVSAWGDALTAIAFAVLINFVIEGHRTPLDRFLNATPVMWLGRLSFSLYLWQQVFCWSRPRDTITGIFPLNVVLSMLAAMASYYLVELPALRLRDRLRPKTRKSSPMGGISVDPQGTKPVGLIPPMTAAMR